jgi:[ribosomal protein S5]-alanine N-acetyltransferase
LQARAATIGDAEHVFSAYATDSAVAKYMTWTPHRDIAETVEFLERCERDWNEGSAFAWTLWTRSTDELAGVIGLRIRDTKADVGYALARRWWRQGLMTEALSAVVVWALAQPEIYRVWATCDVENVASARLLEKIGMTREGVLRRWLVHPNISDEPRDALCYAVVRPVPPGH